MALNCRAGGADQCPKLGVERPTVESALRLDIDSMMCWGAIRPGFHLVGGMRLHQFYGETI
jgi:hypothetical protein